MDSSFVHLHQHTEFSMLDGASRIADVVALAQADGQPALGITDHGNLYGALDFYAACESADITPVIGCELYMAKESRHERPPRVGKGVETLDGDGDKAFYHLTVLAETTEGYWNLVRLASEAFLSGFYKKPRCLLPGQEIVTRDGVKAIEELMVGDEVLTHRGRFRPVLQTMSRRHVGPLVGLRLGNRYRRVTWMTEEHPVLIRNRDGSRSWIEAQDIAAGRRLESDERLDNWRAWVCLPKLSEAPAVDEIATDEWVGWAKAPNRVGSFRKVCPRQGMGPTYHYCSFPDRIPLDYNFGFFLGLYAAEGHISRSSEVTWSFHEDELQLIEHCCVMVEKMTGKTPRIDHRLAREGYRGADVRVSSSLLADLLRQLCGSGASRKHLPSFAFDAPREFQDGLVDGVFAGDGSRRDSTTSFVQTSRALAWQVRTLQTTLRDDFACVAEVNMPSAAHANQFRSNYSPVRELTHRKTVSDDEFVYKPVAEVLTRHYEGFVYNIEVAEDNSYVSDFAIHNCDWELLERHHAGLIVTTGCLGGLVGQALLADRTDEAMAIAGRFQDIFGKSSLFVELQDHGLVDQKRTTPQLLQIAKDLGAPLLATNDSHYARRHDSVTHDALLCIQTGASVADEKRFRFEGTEHYLKSAAEMRALFSELPEACDNTLLIAERANVEIEFGIPNLPTFAVPAEFQGSDEEESASSYLRHLTYEGARRRYGDSLAPEVTQRIDYELGVIGNMGFSTYFLVVWDLIRHARESKIRRGPGRGSAAGCCVAYCLGIVDLDPIRYDLLFERFLNPGRRQMPDIDMDFDERFREEMIRYAAERYGSDHVAQIITFSSMGARAAVRDSARVLGFEYAVGDRIAKAMPPLLMGRSTPIAACLEKVEGYEPGYATAAELRHLYESDPESKKVIDVAAGLEGLYRQDGIHASAVVIAGKPLIEYLPVQRKPDSKAPDGMGPLVTQYEMHGVEALGLLKIDFLGLRYLTVIEHTLDLIEQSEGVRPDIDSIPLDDEPTLDLLRRADSMGVFQLEGGQMRALMHRLSPSSFDDVAALIALYRPGPMAANMHNDYADRKQGRQEVTYLHPDLQPLLADTQGLMIYQESVMRVAQHFAGYSLEEADNLRKSMGKKVREIMRAEREKFVAGCVATGYGEKLGTQLFDVIEPFADYAFNKSHSYGYGVISFQTAWLKAHYPVEYFAALLTSCGDDKDKMAAYLAECRARGIQVLVPDVNRSSADFGVDRSGASPSITYGLAAIRNVGEAIIGLIVSEREANGEFRDFFDFINRADAKALNKRAIESLIKAGAFDSLGYARKGLLLVHEGAITEALRARRDESLGIQSLFGGAGDAPETQATGGPDGAGSSTVPDVEFERGERLAHEKEMLGLYVSDHPLMGFEHALSSVIDMSIHELRELVAAGEAGTASSPVGEMRTTGGVVTELSRRRTKRGDVMATFTLEDLESAVEVIVFPKELTEYAPLLADDTIVTVKGRIDVRDERIQLVCMEIRVPKLVPGDAPELRIELVAEAAASADGLVLDRLKRVLSSHPGRSPVVVTIGDRSFRLPAAFNVSPRAALMTDLERVLGGSLAA